MDGNEELAQAIERVQAAADRFITGDPAPFKALWSHRDDVTLLGGWGAYERGWAQVGPRLDWACARFAGGQQQYEMLAMGSGGELAYTVHLEHGTVQLVGQARPAPMTLRVTHLFRRDAGTWKLVHRHADPISEKTGVAAVVQREEERTLDPSDEPEAGAGWSTRASLT